MPVSAGAVGTLCSSCTTVLASAAYNLGSLGWDARSFAGGNAGRRCGQEYDADDEEGAGEVEFAAARGAAETFPRSM